MHSRLLTAALLILAGCSGSLYTSLAGTTTATPTDAYSCVEGQLKTLEYKRTQYNAKEQWIIAERPNPEEAARGPNVRKTVDVLEVYVKPDPSGSTGLVVQARTFDEFANSRGVDRQERKSTNRVLADARKLGQACAS